MKRGTANEDAIMDALRKLDFVLCFFELRMLSHKSILWIAVSLDRVQIIDIAKLHFEKPLDNCYEDTKLHLEKEKYAIYEFLFIFF